VKEDIRLNVWHEVSVCAQQLGVPELAYFRHLSCKHAALPAQ